MGTTQSNHDLRQAARACRGAFAAVVVFSACVNVLMLAAPLYMLQVFDRVLTSRSTETLLALTLMAGAALLTLAALEAVRSIGLTQLGAWLDNRLGPRVLDASIDASAQSPGGASTEGLRDLGTVRGFLSGPAMVPLMDAPWTPLFIAATFLLHPVLGLIAVAGALVLLALAVLNEACTRAPLREAARSGVLALREADAATRAHEVAEAMGMRDALRARWAGHSRESLARQNEAGRRGALISAVSKFIRLALQSGMLGVGALLVIDNALTPGGMIAATILLGRALAPVDQAIGSWKGLVSARAAWDRLDTLLGEVRAREPGMTLPRPTGELRCEGITYNHPGSREPTLKSVSFELPAGKVLGLAGPSGAGKSTLARLMVGNLTPALGSVRLDGMDVSQWDSSDRGRHVGYLPQSVDLFAATVRENIARMTEGDADRVLEAAELAGAHEMIMRLPQGYDTPVGAGGLALSGGQRQRIALARALYGNPPLVVLDEPNANLDHAGMMALLRCISRLKQAGTTVVVVAHLPIMVRQAHYLVVLGNGTVQMSGPMEQVVARITGPRTDGELHAVSAATEPRGEEVLGHV